ncbi:hypothetical protein ACQEVS_11980 [Streptomyces sp. CA-181903]|uniref:hypothetical protein n=1 Tax=Streptomyces sp. CA-181903 TaxID=3240055 RepID=UPI003D8FA172
MAFWGTPEPSAEAAALGLPAAAGTTGTGTRLTTPPMLPTLLPHGGSLVDVDVPALLVPVGEAVGALAALTATEAATQAGVETGIEAATGSGTGVRADAEEVEGAENANDVDDAEDEAEPAAPDRPWGHSVHAWVVAARLALEHVTAGHLVPVLREAGEGRVRAHWRAVTDGDPRLAALATALPAAAHALRVPTPDGTPGSDGTDPGEARVWSPLALLTAFCDAVADACARASAPAADGTADSWTTILTTTPASTVTTALTTTPPAPKPPPLPPPSPPPPTPPRYQPPPRPPPHSSRTGWRPAAASGPPSGSASASARPPARMRSGR